MEDNKEPMNDIFEQARKDSISKLINREAEVKKDEQRQALAIAIKERLEEGETQWDLLKRMVEGSMTEKFIRIMMDMPDRDFVRNYLKLLEYVKPKMTRVEGGLEDDRDITVNIQTLIVNSKGEKEYVPINQIEDGNKK